MRNSRRLTCGAIGVAALMVGVILGGCGATPTTTAGRSTAASAATATAASAATATAADTPYPTETRSAAAAEAPGCPPVGLGPVPPQYGTVNGLNVSIPQRWTSLDFPDELMPNGEPAAPYQVP